MDGLCAERLGHPSPETGGCPLRFSVTPGPGLGSVEMASSSAGWPCRPPPPPASAAQGPAVTPSRAPVAERSIPAHPRSPCRLGALCPCPWTLALTQVSTNWGLRGARSISHCLEATSLKLRCCQAVLPPGALEGFPPRFFQLPGFQAPLGLGPCPSAISEKALPSHTFSPCLSVSPLLRLRRTLVIIRI